MVTTGTVKIKKWSLLCLLLLTSCSGAASNQRPAEEIASLAAVEQQPAGPESVAAGVGESRDADVQAPRYQPVKEDISPLGKRIVNISVRNTPFRDVVKVVADSANLNLVLQKGVNTEQPVTITLNNVTVKDALDIIFASVDYFYEVKKNLLLVKAQDTMLFEFGHPSVLNSYSLSLGGDILGGASSAGSTSSTIKGDLKLTSASDDKAKNLWEEVSLALTGILKADEGNPLRANFSINRVTGTIMVTASKNTLANVTSFLNRVRESLNRQVMIEARIVEVQLSEGLKYGIDWQQVINWNKLGQIVVGSQGFTNVLLPADPRFNVAISGGNFTATLQALQTQGDVRVLSNPRVSLMNGQTAMLSVGQNRNYLAKVQTTTTTPAGGLPQTTFSVETNSIMSGLVIGIVPYINSDGYVSMTITPIISNLTSMGSVDIGSDPATKVTISLPTVDLREMSTTVRVKDGELVVIGGLIQKSESTIEQGTPFLSKIPLLGYLFKNLDKSELRTELVIMLKPQVAKAED